jgi:hypothetical protein
MVTRQLLALRWFVFALPSTRQTWLPTFKLPRQRSSRGARERSPPPSICRLSWRGSAYDILGRSAERNRDPVDLCAGRCDDVMQSHAKRLDAAPEVEDIDIRLICDQMPVVFVQLLLTADQGQSSAPSVSMTSGCASSWQHAAHLVLVEEMSIENPPRQTTAAHSNPCRRYVSWQVTVPGGSYSGCCLPIDRSTIPCRIAEI